MDEKDESDLGLGGLSIVDQFSGNQSTENQNSHKGSEFLEAGDSEKAMEADARLKVEQLPQSSDPLEPERARKHGKHNLRQSLAWDTAFFTSEGVLEPDELSSMIEGVGKGGKQFLPGIEEDVCRSTDTLSTLESENLTLESLEADLFEDIRASIQKSSKASSMASSSKSATAKTETQALKKVELASNNMVKQKPASKRESMGLQGTGRSIKQSPSCPQGTKPIARNGGLTSSLQKAPKVIGGPNPISSAPSKRASLAANQVKTGNDDAKGPKVAGKVALISKVQGLGGSSRTLPKPVPPSKSSCSNSSTATKKELPKSSASSNSSGSASSPNVGISPVKATRGKTVNPTSTSSFLKTPMKVALKTKGQFGLTDRLMSSKLSSNISPASSISEWSSESCSSTSTVNQRSSTSRASIDTSSPASDRHENKATRPHSDNAKAASKQTDTLSQPATGKPSGLRMPSPKIGFFDGGKSLVRTPNKSGQSYYGIPAGLKIGPGVCSPGGGSSKSMLSKVQPEKVVTTAGDTTVDTRKPASASPPRKLSNVSTKVSSASGSVKNRVSISPQVQNRMDAESCLKGEEVGPRRPNKPNHISDTNHDVEKTGSLGVLKRDMGIEKHSNTNLKDVEITPIEQDTRGSGSHSSRENIRLPKEMGDENELQSLYVEKENGPLEDQVDGLSIIHVGAGSSKQKTQKEHIGNANSPIEFCHSDFTQNKESKTNLSGPAPISLSPVICELTASTRTPLTLKNSFCNGEAFDVSARSSIGVAEKTTTVSSLESMQRENSYAGAHST
ncbi:hypothetical protein RHMOL_Rhmol05G0251000 [Rhododendron molle]|uniref:Uncharacterized protein n=1 Tax=Rhododendron molle TaxID=49168 RepID=A0ACC0NUI0_RHOML|nr:hypothetical protein RHMOL_Rhmol05G0251000 [Rhododendron molle]